MQIMTFVGVAVMLAVSVATASQDQGSFVSDPSGTALLYTTIIGFLSLLATHGFQLWRERRNRQWDLEDREAARAELRKNNETQRLETIATAVQLARAAKIHNAQLVTQIAENTALTLKAGDKAEA